MQQSEIRWSFKSFNSRAPRGARHCFLYGDLVYFCVSIHVPLAEHDMSARVIAVCLVVSIHVPLAEHDLRLMPVARLTRCFNSRAPRGARRFGKGLRPFAILSFNSRAPRGARLFGLLKTLN